ncbi:MAG: aldehyde ferredoxin oxidoreductase family protein [Deltaproteobacteria bacterium]|nr:aldehyde ferredoxin oxidoreductase family protein [Deltaproteobacteria bacterium]
MERGYMGRILMVDLTKGECIEEKIPDELYEYYLSGTGLAAKILYDRIPARADPLGPDNILGFVSGLLTGTGSMMTGRWMVVGKSPLTGTWGDANCGGSFSPAIKRCGYDGIFFHGISKKPVYLYVGNRTAELRDASLLWGKDAVETEEILIQQNDEHGKKPKIVCIGQSGEKISLISGISNDRGRMAARSGLGAVMGSKKLKAVVCAGNLRIGAADRDQVHHLSRKFNEFIMQPTPNISAKVLLWAGKILGMLPIAFAMDGSATRIIMRKWGTVGVNQMSVEMGDTPIKNWMGSPRDWGSKKSASVNPDHIVKREREKYHCYACPVGCGGICATTGKYKETHKPEYETCLALSGFCMNDDTESIYYLNEILNRAGMDTISAGATVAFAIECFERGVLTKDDTNGLELRWGNTEAIKDLLEKMIAREGIGDVLADGTKKAAEKIGKGSMEWAVHAGGQEPAMHDGRNDPGFALHYSVEPTPGRHTIGSFQYYELFQLWSKIPSLPRVKPISTKNSRYRVTDEQIIQAAALSRFINVVNGSGMCLMGVSMGISRIPVFEWLNAVTGWSKDPEEYMLIGERIQTIKQAFNIKHGIEPRDMKISDRALGLPKLQEGPNKGRSVDIDLFMSKYWDYFGWDPQTGKPTHETMNRLNLGA